MYVHIFLQLNSKWLAYTMTLHDWHLNPACYWVGECTIVNSISWLRCLLATERTLVPNDVISTRRQGPVSGIFWIHSGRRRQHVIYLICSLWSVLEVLQAAIASAPFILLPAAQVPQKHTLELLWSPCLEPVRPSTANKMPDKTVCKSFSSPEPSLRSQLFS